MEPKRHLDIIVFLEGSLRILSKTFLALKSNFPKADTILSFPGVELEKMLPFKCVAVFHKYLLSTLLEVLSSSRRVAEFQYQFHLHPSSFQMKFLVGPSCSSMYVLYVLLSQNSSLVKGYILLCMLSQTFISCRFWHTHIHLYRPDDDTQQSPLF